jgi:hypothetical protein
VDLSDLVRHEDIVEAAEEVVKKFDFGTNNIGVEMNFRRGLGRDAAVVNKLAI